MLKFEFKFGFSATAPVFIFLESGSPIISGPKFTLFKGLLRANELDYLFKFNLSMALITEGIGFFSFNEESEFYLECNFKVLFFTDFYGHMAALLPLGDYLFNSSTGLAPIKEPIWIF